MLNKLAGEALLILASIINLGKSDLCKHLITEDDLDRISTNIRLISDQWPQAKNMFLNESRISLELMLLSKGDIERHVEKKPKQKIIQVYTY